MEANIDTGMLLAEGQAKILKSNDGHQSVKVKIIDLTFVYLGSCQVRILKPVGPGKPNGFKPGMILNVRVDDLVDRL